MSDTQTPAHDSIGNPIHTEAASSDAPEEQLRDSVGSPIGIQERDQPATLIVEEYSLPIKASAVNQIRELTERLSAPEAAIAAQIRGLLPS